MAELDAAVIAEYNRAFENVFQLPDVSRPIVIDQSLHNRRINTFDVQTELLVMDPQELTNKLWNILFPGFQFWQVQVYDL